MLKVCTSCSLFICCHSKEKNGRYFPFFNTEFTVRLDAQNVQLTDPITIVGDSIMCDFIFNEKS
jgi:hypothetical protein